MNLSDYIKRVPEFAVLSRTPSKLVPFLALFLELEDADRVVAPKDINDLFDQARVRRPANVSATIAGSGAFVKVKGGGYRLAHDAREHLLNQLSPATVAGIVSGEPEKVNTISARSTFVSERDVFVVYGRDDRLRSDLFSFLRALGLNPLEFGQMAHLTGSASPTTLQVIRTGFERTQACVVLFSPDEQVSLREDLRIDGNPEQGMQPRPNVFIEGGMALALCPERTILVKIGDVREVSDLSGLHYVRLTKEPSSRNRLVSKLETAGCKITRHGDDWLEVGTFAVEV